MWLSFWVAVLLGLVSALPVLNRPELEGLWVKVGLFSTIVVNAVAPKPQKMETVVVSVDPPITFQAPALNQQESLPEAVGGYISGLLVDIAAYFVTGIAVILFVLVVIGGEKAKEKRRALFPLFWDKGPRP